jgi:hypothetical protein
MDPSEMVLNPLRYLVITPPLSLYLALLLPLPCYLLFIPPSLCYLVLIPPPQLYYLVVILLPPYYLLDIPPPLRYLVFILPPPAILNLPNMEIVFNLHLHKKPRRSADRTRNENANHLLGLPTDPLSPS